MGTIVPFLARMAGRGRVEPHHPFRSTWCRPLEDIMVLSVKSSHVSHIGLRCCCVLYSAAGVVDAAGRQGGICSSQCSGVRTHFPSGDCSAAAALLLL